MDLRVLQYFLAVAREESISAAAQSLHLTQPTLSRQLKELEEELGKQLLIRGNRRITLTEEGMLLQKEPAELHTVATYNLIYNASLMVDEGMGYAFTLDKLVNTRGSNLCFRPLEPRMELGMCLVWKKYQVFSKAAELFLSRLRQQVETKNSPLPA